MKEKLLVAGGVVSALAASMCCAVPLTLAALGVGSAGLAGVGGALAPYQPLFLAGAVVCLGAGFWLVYRPTGGSCASDDTGARVVRLLRNVLWVKGVLWLGAALVAFSVSVDLGARML